MLTIVDDKSEGYLTGERELRSASEDYSKCILSVYELFDE